MITWQKTKYGYRFTASGTTTEEEMMKLAQEVKESFPDEDSEFFVFADLRGFAIFSPECKVVLEELQRFFSHHWSPVIWPALAALLCAAAGALSSAKTPPG